MNKWIEMQAFCQVVESGSFSSAAEQLGQSPSAISKTIQRLENRLATRLFIRSTRKLNLTEAGQGYYQRCRDLLQELDLAEQQVSQLNDKPSGKLRISCSAGFGKYQLLPRLARFQQQYPHINIELLFSGEVVDIIDGGFDLAIRLGQLQSSALVSRKLGRSRRIICASPGYLKKHGEPQRAKDLAEHNCLQLNSVESFNHWQLNGRSYPVTGQFITDNVQSLMDYCLQGGGIARLANFMVAEDIAKGRLLPLLTDQNKASLDVNLVYPHRRLLPAKVKVFIDFLIDNIKL